MTKLTNGKIPAGTVCPFRGECKMLKTCAHKGVEHTVDFSCGAARAYDTEVQGLQGFLNQFNDRVAIDKSFTVSWSAQGIGFGSFQFYPSAVGGPVKCDNECMGKVFIRRMLCKLVDDCQLLDEPSAKPKINEENVRAIMQKYGVRLVGFNEYKDAFGESITILHGHSNDMMTCNSADAMLERLERFFVVHAVFDPANHNTILMKERYV